jgi:hypothetical protein
MLPKFLLNLLEIFRQGFVTSRLPAKKSYSTKSFRRKFLGRYKYLKGFYVLNFFRVIRRIYATLIPMGKNCALLYDLPNLQPIYPVSFQELTFNATP